MTEAIEARLRTGRLLGTEDWIKAREAEQIPPNCISPYGPFCAVH
ncbi:MAG: hypothetical protein ABL881_06865 [Novosphingobium sp.]